VSGFFQNIDPPPPSPPSECVLPPHQEGGGGVHIRRAVRGRGGGGGQYCIIEDARHWIGLSQRFFLSVCQIEALPVVAWKGVGVEPRTTTPNSVWFPSLVGSQYRKLVLLSVQAANRLNIELDLQSLFGLLCTAVLIG
jgi:hypothetical protein